MWDLKILNTDKPFYKSIADAIERDIQCGILKPGDKMPTHRQLAKTIGVDITTVTRAYQEAEKRGFVTATVGKGTFITSDLGRNPSLLDTADKAKSGNIEMGLVLPLYSAEPDIRTVLSKIINRKSLNGLMRYTPPQGLYEHRKIAAGWIRRFGVDAGADQVIITAGSQHAIDCILSSLFQPGDHIAVDCLTYPGIKTAAKQHGIQLDAVAMDRNGMLPDDLETVCSHSDIRGIYTMSRMQNPTNSVMSGQRREEIARIIKRKNLLLVEDDIYGFLSSDSAPLTSLIPENSVFICGISKAFYAGLRTSFLLAPERYCYRISQAVVDTVWMAPTLNSEIACECISSGMAEKIIQEKLENIKIRADLLSEAFSGFHFDYEPNSMFAWLKLPDRWGSGSFEKAANRFGVNIYASDKFAVGGFVPPDCVRVSLTGADDLSEFQRGLEILRKLLNSEIGEVSGIL